MILSRVVLGLGLFVASSWVVPMVANLIGLTGPMVYATFGSLLAFTGGMVMHSGVRSSAWYR